MARGKKFATTFEKGAEQAVITGEVVATLAQEATTAHEGAPAEAATQHVSPPTEAPTVASEAPVAQPERDPAPAPRKRGRPPKSAAAKVAPSGDLTMAQLADRYIESLRDAGKGLGTQFSYSIDIAVAVKHFGEDALVSSLTARKVQNFFDSDAVTKTRTGKAKAKPGIDKTRRVLRMALVWAAEQGLIAEAPVPESAMPRAKKDTEAA